VENVKKETLFHHHQVSQQILIRPAAMKQTLRIHAESFFFAKCANNTFMLLLAAKAEAVTPTSSSI